MVPLAALARSVARRLTAPVDRGWFAHDVVRNAAVAGRDVAVRALAFVVLNGRPPRMLIDPTVDLAATPRTWTSVPWVLPYRP